MRILLINPNTTSSITGRMATYAGEVAGGAATFIPVTGRFGARYISTRAAAAIAGHAALDALAEHVDGCDAVYLACFGDPGLLACKELSPVPVVGMAEASCIEAASGGRRFAIVTGGVLWKPMLQEFVATLGLSAQLAAVRPIAPTGDQIASDPEGALALLADACNARKRGRRRDRHPWWCSAGRFGRTHSAARACAGDVLRCDRGEGGRGRCARTGATCTLGATARKRGPWFQSHKTDRRLTPGRPEAVHRRSHCLLLQRS